MRATAPCINNSLESPSLGGDVVGVVLAPVEEVDRVTKWGPRGLESMRPLLEPSRGLDSRLDPKEGAKIGLGAAVKSEDGLSPVKEVGAEGEASLKEEANHVIEVSLGAKREMVNADLDPRIAEGLIP